ncbi:small acid-soluble spore protein O [Rummeliibacillus pycnus]|uniref:small acid-soluble spore protein O n=1 Tax=Rummeliibacillus pycnus TaxID=101070 RepID=UPI003D2BA9EF
MKNKIQKVNKQLNKDFSDKQATRSQQSREFNQEFANEPLTATEKLNNKKTKKRQ